MTRPFIVCTLVAALAACSDDTSTPVAADSGTPRVDAAADAPVTDVAQPDAAADAPVDAATPTVDPPATPAGAQLAWMLSMLNGNPSDVDDATLTAHLSPIYVRPAAYNEFRTIFAALAMSDGPFALLRVLPDATNTALGAVLLGRGGRYEKLTVTTETAATGRITALGYAQAPEFDPTLTDWAAFDRRFTAVTPRARMLAAEISSGACVPVHGVEATTQSPLGAEYNLWVLATLASQIAAGTHTWSEQLAVRNAWQSISPDTVDYLSVGMTHTLQQYATLMIVNHSDTATDHLVRTVGRERVEATLGATRHAMPARDVPFLTTRERYQLVLGVSDAERMTYLAGDAARRRTYLDTTLAPMTLNAALDALGDWTAPRHVDDLGWYASPTDVCNVFASLRAMSEAPGGDTVLHVFPIIPGLVDTRVFPYVGYIAGREPGVFSASFMLRRDDGRWFVVSSAYSDPTTNLDVQAARYFAFAAMNLVGRH